MDKTEWAETTQNSISPDLNPVSLFYVEID